MTPRITKLGVLTVTAIGLLILASSAWAADKAPTAEEVKKIADAAQGLVAAKPEKPRKLLVFSVAYGYWHDSIPCGQEAVKAMAARTGAFEATVSDDLANFEPEKLKSFDAVFFNNVNEEIFLPAGFDKLSAEDKAKATERDAELKKSLAAFIAGGKGLAAIHAATNAFRQWPEYGDILGARFDNHPWGAGSTVTLKIDDPTHPVVKAFKGEPFKLTDEVYQVADPYSREKVRVLLSIDTAATNMNVQGLHRKDNDFAIAWVKPCGQGRVFYSAIGHEHALFWNPTVLQHFLDGIQFALGDLKGETKPSASPR